MARLGVPLGERVRTVAILSLLWEKGILGGSKENAMMLRPNVEYLNLGHQIARLLGSSLEAATTLQNLAVLPGNRFETLKGNRKGQYSIRINDQWRVCLHWPKGSPGPVNVEIVDYH